MRKCYTRPCNFYYGNYARKLIEEKKALSLTGRSNIAFDQIEIFKREMNKGTSPIGKKLEFITQEMMREANTLGNKLPDLYPIVIEIKSTIDKLRQQVANVE